MKFLYTFLLVSCLLIIPGFIQAQTFSRQDTLRGSITPERAWWDLTYYDLAIDFDIQNKFIRGTNMIAFNVMKSHQTMQIDLQEPLAITHVEFKGNPLSF